MEETNTTGAEKAGSETAPNTLSPELVDAAKEFEAAVDAPVEKPAEKIHVAARVYGVLLILGSIIDLVVVGGLVALLGLMIYMGQDVLIGEQTTLSLVLSVISIVLTLGQAVLGIMLGRSLFKSRRRRVAVLSRADIVATILGIIVTIMLNGMGSHLIQPVVQLAILIALSVRIDPTLARERRVERAIDAMENAEEKQAGMEGRDTTGKGYLDLNFFTLFWEFVVCCILGLVLEIIWHMTVVDPGVYQDRAGLLFGPFSPIYGFGAVLVTLALNRLYNKNLVVIFVVSAIVGGAFEAAVSLFMQLGFGATAWDYSSYTILGQPDPIAVVTGGRTSTMFVVMWGVLGLVWVKAFLPLLLKVVNLIPWKARYALTAVCCALMLVNGVMTLESLDCWFERVSGIEPTTAAGKFYAEYFDDDYMANRFQSMTIEPKESTRVSAEAATPEA